MSDTIAAISTPAGSGGISVIRISGSRAVQIADSIFTASIENVPSHTVHYGYIEFGGERIDEVLVTVMRGPKTFTAEDTVEISTHGGPVVTNRVIDAIIRSGARPAAAGEFTKRAFMNGRIDLARAEAVIDLINSGNVLAGRNAVAQLSGKLSGKIEAMRSGLVNLAAHMQVSIDYPDEELEEITTDDILSTLKDTLKNAETLIKSADDGRIVRDGIRTVIAGKPNVGKSTLLNCLCGGERAIVTDIAGTTRDIIEQDITVRGIPVKLIDTAGIHETDDTIEKIGVKRSEETLESADLVIVVIDGSTPPDSEDMQVLEKTKDMKRIIAVNKSDKGLCTEAEKLGEVFISAKNDDGVDKIADIISNMYNIGEIMSSNGEIITNLRHKTALINCHEALIRAVQSIECGMPQDIASIDINEAIDALGEITGATVSEDIVSAVFSNFCVGK